MTKLTHDSGRVIDVADATFYLAHGWRPYTEPVELPSTQWSIARIDSWAEENGIDLSDAKIKQDKLDAIAAALAPKEDTDAADSGEAPAVPAAQPAA
jgi:hypothetical protein